MLWPEVPSPARARLESRRSQDKTCTSPPPEDVHALIPRACDCYLTRLVWLRARPWDGESSLPYSGGLNLAPWVLKRGEHLQLRERDVRMEGGWGDVAWEGPPLLCWLWRWRKEVRAKGHGQALEAGRGKEMDSPRELPGRKAARPTPDFSLWDLCQGFWPVWPWDRVCVC